MKRIPLTQGKFAIVDDVDFDWLNQYKWYSHIDRSKNIFYVNRGRRWGKRMITILMHRLIMNPIKGMFIDHINGNGLDNRRSNLRICTRSQNGMNRKMQNNNTSGYKGVIWSKSAKKWQVQIIFNKKRIHLGYFKIKKEGALAYNEASLKYFGKFAYINRVYKMV